MECYWDHSNGELHTRVKSSKFRLKILGPSAFYTGKKLSIRKQTRCRQISFRNFGWTKGQLISKANSRVCSRSREPLYYCSQLTIFMGHSPPWLSYQLFRQQVVKREGKFKLPKWPNLDIWSTWREPNSKWPPAASYSYNGPPFLIMSRLTYPNDLPMTSNGLCKAVTNMFPYSWPE